MDMEKVIKGLRICFMHKDCDGCPYQKELKAILDKTHNDDWHCPILDDVIAILKKQEAVEPQAQPSAKGYWFTCGACGWWLFEVRDTVHFDDRKRIRFCASCGQAVKWE